MSTASSQGRGRAVLLIVLVVVLAVVAAVATVIVSQKTYAPTERRMSAAIQVAAGSEYTDEIAGLTFRVPEGWRAETGPLPIGSTVMVPEELSEGSGPGGIVFIGTLTPAELSGPDVDNRQLTYELAQFVAQLNLPVPVEPVEDQLEEISTRAGDGWGLSLRVKPLVEQAMIGPEGAVIYSAVVGEGEYRHWLTYIGLPADGSMKSPEAAWAEQIVKRFRPA